MRKLKVKTDKEGAGFRRRSQRPVSRQETVVQCQQHLTETYFELNSYAFIFCNLKNCEISEDDLYGIGIALSKIAKRVSRVSEQISKAAGLG